MQSLHFLLMITAKAQKINAGILSLFTLAYKHLCTQSRRALAGPCWHGWHTCVPVAWSQAARQQTCCGLKRSRRSQVWDVCPQRWGCEEKSAQATELPASLCFGWVCVRVHGCAVLKGTEQCRWHPTLSDFHPFPTEQLPPFLYPIKADHGQLSDIKGLSSAARKGNKRHQ